MKTKKLTTIFVLLIIIAFAYESYNISLTEFKLSDQNASYLAGLNWSRSLDKSLLQAQQENKPVAMYFWATWCLYCAKFQTETLGNPQVKKLLEEDFIIVAMDLDVDKYVSYGPYSYNGYPPPKLLFLDPNGKELAGIYGAQNAAYFIYVATNVRDQIRSN
ncbi:MAG: thioredoxin family protein [Euryarchaeota archaeon]|nr:thioredoxin family protein [Euryarchaeota archaeon]MCG2737535.1 thioredoxin family protein [Candidatus Methanoperedenaceae archaeon]